MSAILARIRRSVSNGADGSNDASTTSSPSLSGAPPGHPDSHLAVQRGMEKDSSAVDGSKLEKAASKAADVDLSRDDVAKVDVVLAQQNDGDIKYRTMSWQKCAAILFGEYVCLAILSFPWAFNTLGMAGGILATLGMGVIALYTSMVRAPLCILRRLVLTLTLVIASSRRSGAIACCILICSTLQISAISCSASTG